MRWVDLFFGAIRLMNSVGIVSFENFSKVIRARKQGATKQSTAHGRTASGMESTYIDGGPTIKCPRARPMPGRNTKIVCSWMHTHVVQHFLLATSAGDIGTSRFQSTVRGMENPISPIMSSRLSAVHTSNVRFAVRTRAAAQQFWGCVGTPWHSLSVFEAQTHVASAPQHVPTLVFDVTHATTICSWFRGPQASTVDWCHQHHFELSDLFHRTF